jgi:amidohydrolase
MMIKAKIEAHKDTLVKYRRHFHQHPEVSWGEVKTAAYIKAELDRHHIPYRSIAGTGVEVLIEGQHPGKTVALRGDIDALQVHEKTDHDYKSTLDGVMHACGHDGHTAMLLCAAIILNTCKSQIHGRIKLLFQPAEEMVEGAKVMIKEGALEGVDAILGIHLWTGLETGKISIEPGPRMASGDYIRIDIEGRGGHGSLPHQTVDATLMAAAFISNIQTLISREIDPLESVVLSFGEIRSGTRFNVLSGHAELVGTARCFNPEIRKGLAAMIRKHGEGICKSYRGTFNLQYQEGTPPTINDGPVAKFAQGLVETYFGQGTLANYEKTTGSEDMAYYLEKVPGIMAFVGAGNAAKGCDYPHHHPMFDIDEDSLVVGLELYVRFALSYLTKA